MEPGSAKIPHGWQRSLNRLMRRAWTSVALAAACWIVAMALGALVGSQHLRILDIEFSWDGTQPLYCVAANGNVTIGKLSVPDDNNSGIRERLFASPMDLGAVTSQKYLTAWETIPFDPSVDPRRADWPVHWASVVRQPYDVCVRIISARIWLLLILAVALAAWATYRASRCLLKTLRVTCGHCVQCSYPLVPRDDQVGAGTSSDSSEPPVGKVLGGAESSLRIRGVNGLTIAFWIICRCTLTACIVCGIFLSLFVPDQNRRLFIAEARCAGFQPCYLVVRGDSLIVGYIWTIYRVDTPMKYALSSDAIAWTRMLQFFPAMVSTRPIPMVQETTPEGFVYVNAWTNGNSTCGFNVICGKIWFWISICGILGCMSGVLAVWPGRAIRLAARHSGVPGNAMRDENGRARCPECGLVVATAAS